MIFKTIMPLLHGGQSDVSWCSVKVSCVRNYCSWCKNKCFKDCFYHNLTQ